MKRAVRVVFATLAVLATACSNRVSYVMAVVDPDYSPSKADPIFVTLSTEPTIRERQLKPVLDEELCRNGFNVVSAVGASKWTLGLSYERRTYEFGSTAVAAIVGSGLIVGSSMPNVVTDSTAYLYLFPSESLVASKPVNIWEGSVRAKENVFQAYRPIIFKNLLDAFGTNRDMPIRLSKPYLYDHEACPPTKNPTPR